MTLSYMTLLHDEKEISYSGDEVTIYACGITPYSPSHIGHARQAIAFDTLVRWLNFNQINTRYVTNFTIYQIRLLMQRKKRSWLHRNLKQTHRKYVESMKALNVGEADAYPELLKASRA